jgi:hypothetical protein
MKKKNYFKLLGCLIITLFMLSTVPVSSMADKIEATRLDYMDRLSYSSQR